MKRRFRIDRRFNYDYEHEGSETSSKLFMKSLFMTMRASPVFLSVSVVKSGIVVAAAVTVKAAYPVVPVVAVTAVLDTVVISLT